MQRKTRLICTARKIRGNKHKNELKSCKLFLRGHLNSDNLPIRNLHLQPTYAVCQYVCEEYICLVADLLIAQGGSLKQLFPKGILIEAISLKYPCNLVVKASLFDGRFLLRALMGMDHLRLANQSVQKLRDFFHQHGICLFDLASALAAAPLLNTFAPCILPTMHRLTAGWTDDRNFQPVDSGLSIRA